uniref:RING-type E3 ubiquitin transferase n=1 Tax=Lepisosteus oculatus TaxID=7918 RepID=W5MFW0_LEPOC
SSAMDQKSGKDTERSCVLCCQELDIFAVGKCDHPVCYRCSTKMRVLCQQKYCAVCREELDKVIFVKKLEPFAAIRSQQLQCEKKYDIYFSDSKIYAQFRKILQSECPQCPEPRVFSKFEELEHHMRKQHELFCCKLCVKYLKIFTHERRWYNRKELARHRTQGDPDDTSHRGHPLCKFCDDRYLDNDELLKHLRTEHYFCHFCDSDGAQEYYSDYEYLREHFREKHYLCEEGRCSTEQFTHAFRTEIDYKAHKASSHSKNRAEARLNRYIDLQFSYASRHQRRNEVVGVEDYEEAESYVRSLRPTRGGARGGQQNRRGSWRYNREEEDREIAAAVRASVAARRLEEKRQAQEREPPKPRKEEAMEAEDGRNLRSTTKPPSEAPGPKEASKSVNGSAPLKGEDFPVLGATAAPMASIPSAIKSVPVELKEDDFPSLSSVALTSPMTTAYTAQPRKPSSFQEEDFPALVSKIKPHKPLGGTSSAWANAANKNLAKPAAPAFSSSSPSQAKKKPAPGNNAKASSRAKPACSDDEDDKAGRTTQEIRSIPTMLDISSLLTGKTSSPPASKVGKRKKVGGERPTPSSSSSSSSSSSLPPAEEAAPAVAQKENVPDSKAPTPDVTAPVFPAAPKTNPLVNGHADKPPDSSGVVVPKEPPGLRKQVAPDPCPLPEEEEFPALMPKKPPPGFKTAFPMKGGQTGLPPPPPGLATPISKPPPGFTGISLNANLLEPAIPSVTEPVYSAGTYLVPENFQARNMELIKSIKKFLNNDESKFNEFKTYSGQFRQGLISAAQYHRSCRDLLGENFKRIFNELLVLLPDTGKQQELLSAHSDLRVLEKQGGSKPRKNKKSAWQTGTANNNLDLDCQICPTCRQVLAQEDFVAHKTLHAGDEDFPSLQAISRIIS